MLCEAAKEVVDDRMTGSSSPEKKRVRSPKRDRSLKSPKRERESSKSPRKARKLVGDL